MFFRLFPPFMGEFLEAGFKGILLSGWISLPMAAVGLSTLALVWAIVSIDYNGKQLVYVLYFSDGNNETNGRVSFALCGWCFGI